VLGEYSDQNIVIGIVYLFTTQLETSLSCLYDTYSLVCKDEMIRFLPLKLQFAAFELLMR